MQASTVINILIVILMAWFIYSRFAPIKGLRNLSASDFQDELGNNKHALIIDVREPFEYKSGFIPKAINIPLSQLKNRYGEIATDKHLYLYCRSGMRSKQAARLLRKQGFTNLAHLQGGMMAWKGAVRR